MIAQLKSIIKYVSHCNFYCKDGYHHFPYIADSPQAMLEGFRHLPFVTINESSRLVSTNNLWLKNSMHYIELETGLWLLIHNAYFKANICGKAIYEETESNYYSLFYNINKSKIRTQNILFKDVEINSHNCTLHRPGSEICAYIPKDTHAIVVNFLFDRNWAERNIHYQSLPSNNSLRTFFEKQLELLVSSSFTTEVEHLVQDICERINYGVSNPIHVFELKGKANELLMAIIGHFGNHSHESSSSINYKMISIIEVELNKTLRSHFPGLELFAKACNCSISKVKYIAEEFYGKGGISAVHQKKRMELAKQIIELNSHKYIKEIAFELGYESAGKFTEAYKKHFGFPPTMTIQ